MPLLVNKDTVAKVNLRVKRTDSYALLQQMYCEDTLVYSAASLVVYHIWDAQGIQETIPMQYGTDATDYEPTKPNDPSWNDWKFVGWRDDTQAPVADEDVLSSKIVGLTTIHLYAVFKKAVTVTYASGGGSGNVTAQTLDYYWNASGEERIPSFTIKQNGFSKTGHSFAGWKAGQITYNAGTPYDFKNSVTLTAQWDANDYAYNIVYKSNTGKSLGSTTITKKYGTTNTISPPSKAGYTSPSTQEVIWDSTSAKTITFTYTPIVYNITVDCNGGSGVGSSNYTIESSAITLGKPTRTSYNFAGWTGSNGSTAQTTVTIPTGSTGNKSYTATWTQKPWNTIYNNNTPSWGYAAAKQNCTYNAKTWGNCLCIGSNSGADQSGWLVLNMQLGFKNVTKLRIKYRTYSSNTRTNGVYVYLPTSTSDPKKTQAWTRNGVGTTVEIDVAKYTHTGYICIYNSGGPMIHLDTVQWV